MVIEHKTKFSDWMSSHCPVPSRRKELQKYIEVDHLELVGKRCVVPELLYLQTV